MPYDLSRKIKKANRPKTGMFYYTIGYGMFKYQKGQSENNYFLNSQREFKLLPLMGTGQKGGRCSNVLDVVTMHHPILNPDQWEMPFP